MVWRHVQCDAVRVWTHVQCDTVRVWRRVLHLSRCEAVRVWVGDEGSANGEQDGSLNCRGELL